MNKSVSYVFEAWEAIELFLRIITKYNDRNFNVVEYSNEKIIALLNEYEDQELGKNFAAKTFGKKGVNSKSRSHQRLMYDISSSIRQDRPITITERAFRDIADYLEDREERKEKHDHADKDYILTLYKKNRREKFELSSVQRDYENTNWFLYHYEERNNKNLGVREVGISRAVVRFKRYGRVEIDVYDQKREQLDVLDSYVGQYKLIENDIYLSMDLKLAKKFKKGLHLLFYNGTHSRQEFALGQYYNFGESIYSGTAIIRRAAGKSTTLKPKFLNKTNVEDFNSIDPVLWEYFKEKCRNKSKVKIGLTTLDDFKAWLRGKNPGK